MHTISQLTLQVPHYLAFLHEKERADATVQKYAHDVQVFLRLCFELDDEPEIEKVRVTKQTMLLYKRYLTQHYKPAGVNCKLAAVNGFLAFCGLHSLQVQQLKVQRSAFCSKSRELTKQEYQRLLHTAQKKDERLFMLLQTICSTGIRVSELPFITLHSLRTGRAIVTCKNKTRNVLLPKALCTQLQMYCRRRGIYKGSVFVTSSGKPLDRSNIWAMMKRLCATARVSKSKVFPHNLRHLFARTFYAAQKDVVKLADVLGHTRIDTTRIYIISTGSQHEGILNGLGLLAAFPNTEEYLRL